MENLDHALKLGMICPIYLFYGEELLLMEERVRRIADLVSPAGEDWNRESCQGGDIDPAELVMNAQSGGFMGMRRLMVVRNINWLKRGKKAKDEAEDKDEESAALNMEPLIAYAADPNPDTVLILMVNGNVPANSRLLKAVNKGGRAVYFPLYRWNDREKWLDKYLREAGKKPARGVVSYVAQMSGEGLLALKSEADKLLLYTQNSPEIIMDDVRAIISRSSLSGVFELSDLLAEKRGQEAVEILRRLCLQGEAPEKLLAMLGTQYHNTLAVKDMMEHGFTSREAASRLGMSPFVVSKCLQLAKHYSKRQIGKALELLLNANIAQRRGEGDMKELLELAILRVCAM